MRLIFCLNFRKDQLQGKPGKYFLARGPVRLGVPRAATQVKTALARRARLCWRRAVQRPGHVHIRLQITLGITELTQTQLRPDTSRLKISLTPASLQL